ncbi:MAG: alpha/beta fold hydrolase [Rhodoblastus sp.]
MSASVAHTSEQFAPANGMKLCYDTFGDKSAPTIMLIMGLGAQMILWDDGFCSEIAARGFHVVRFDNRDIGRSSRVDVAVKIDFAELIQKQMKGEKIEAPYLLRDMAADAVGLLDHLGIRQAHVVGASMGGMISQEIAMNFPDRLLTLTSIMSTTGNPAPAAADAGGRRRSAHAAAHNARGLYRRFPEDVARAARRLLSG